MCPDRGNVHPGGNRARQPGSRRRSGRRRRGCAGIHWWRGLRRRWSAVSTTADQRHGRDQRDPHRADRAKAPHLSCGCHCVVSPGQRTTTVARLPSPVCGAPIGMTLTWGGVGAADTVGNVLGEGAGALGTVVVGAVVGVLDGGVVICVVAAAQVTEDMTIRPLPTAFNSFPPSSLMSRAFTVRLPSAW